MKNNFIIKSNQKLNVIINKQIIEEVINNLLLEYKLIKISTSDTKVKVSQDNRDFEISLTIQIKENTNIISIIKKINEMINEQSLFLLDKKPKNIDIKYISEFN